MILLMNTIPWYLSTRQSLDEALPLLMPFLPCTYPLSCIKLCVQYYQLGTTIHGKSQQRRGACNLLQCCKRLMGFDCARVPLLIIIQNDHLLTSHEQYRLQSFYFQCYQLFFIPLMEVTEIDLERLTLQIREQLCYLKLKMLDYLAQGCCG